MRGGLAAALFVFAVCSAHEALADPPAYGIGTLTFHGSELSPTYQVGTLVFHGSTSVSVATYAIGTLAFHGAASVDGPQYAIGVLIFHGKEQPTPIEYDVGTLRFAGRPSLQKELTKQSPLTATTSPNPPPEIDLSTIFGSFPPPADPQPTTTNPPAPVTSTLSRYRLLNMQPAITAPSSDLH